MPAFHAAPAHAAARRVRSSPTGEPVSAPPGASVARARTGWPEPAPYFRPAHMPYSAFLAAASLSCAAYAIQVDSDPSAVARPSRPAPAPRPCGDAPDAHPSLFRKTAP